MAQQFLLASKERLQMYMYLPRISVIQYSPVEIAVEYACNVPVDVSPRNRKNHYSHPHVRRWLAALGI